MKETWLRPNQRILGLQLALSGLGCLATLVVAIWIGQGDRSTVVKLLSWLPFLAMAWLVVGLVRALTTPRLQLVDDKLGVHFAAGQSYRIPIDVVECFFLGQGPTGSLPAAIRGAEASSVVVRLSERAEDWHRRPVSPQWGHWCDGYVTLRGTWCEPISLARVNELNHRLATVKREQRERRRG
ncbi:MAG: hypothetical protein U0795_08580 [Pirellulales bacterium]